MATERRTVKRVSEADEAREALREALRCAGIQLPSMDVRPSGRADGSGYTLVDLGLCAPVVAGELAAVIARGAAR